MDLTIVLFINSIDTMPLKSIINMDKRTKIYAIVGGIWGLFNGIIIIFYLRRWAFVGADTWNHYFTHMPTTFKIIFLPTYLAHQLLFLPLSELGLLTSIYSPLSITIFLLFLLIAIIMPILFGIGISLLAKNLIDKGKKVLKK